MSELRIIITNDRVSRRRSAGRVAVAVALAALVACGGDDDGPRPVTYYEDVAPILRSNCMSCHQEDGTAPFSLTSYEEVRDNATAVVAMTASRKMPPVPAAADGSCQTFRDAQWLTTEQLDIIKRWADAGSPPGDAANDPGEPDAISHLGNEAVTLQSAQAYTPNVSATRQDDYRCFLIDPGLTTTQFVTATEFIPATELAHHMALFTVDPDQMAGPETNRQALAALEAADAAYGWECYGSVGGLVQPQAQIGSWAPGTGLTEMPPDTGMAIKAGELVVMQIHFRRHDDDSPAPDRSTIKFRFAPSVKLTAVTMFRDPFLVSLFEGNPSMLEPGRAAVPYHWELPVSNLFDEVEQQQGRRPTGLSVIGMAPHMHELGRRYEAALVSPQGTSSCAIQIPSWDFAWQRSYFYQAAMTVTDPATKVDVTCTYDTRGVTTPVYPGHDAGFEMCSLIVNVVPTF